MKNHMSFGEFIQQLQENVEIDEAAWAEKAAYRLGLSHGAKGTPKIDAEKMFGNSAQQYHDGYKKTGKVTGNMTWSRAPKKVDEERIDELSRKTLAGYVKKAGGPDISNSVAGNAIKSTENRNNGKWDKNTWRKTLNRGKGVERAADRLAKEETDVNELSQEKLKRYVARVKEHDDDKGIYSDNEKTYEKRRVGLAKARKRVSEEAIDEVSKDLARRYLKKNDAETNKIEKTNDLPWNWSGDDKKTYAKRTRGARLATNVIKSVGKYPKTWNRAADEYNRKLKTEETEIDEMQVSAKFNKAIGNQKGAVKKLFKSISQRNNVDRDSGATYKGYALGARKALGPKRPVAEEQIDEISNKKAGAYYISANQWKSDLGDKLGDERHQRDGMGWQISNKENRGLDNRSKGIANAKKRILKNPSIESMRVTASMRSPVKP